MDKLTLATGDIYDENVRKLGELFPDVVTEVREPDGTLRYVIDTEALQAHVGDVADDTRERYQFTWPGKREAKAEAHRRIDKAMRPCPEKSVDWDTTGNLYIEGDNLDALKILRDTYAGKVKMIYIDPPYNTGHDFVYNDDRAQSVEDYEDASGAFDDEGQLLDAAYKENTESNGRFHSDWCSMMYPRLMLARDLLSEDGAIFISIDEGEYSNLIDICYSVFGSENKIESFHRVTKKSSNSGNNFSPCIDYVVVFARHQERIPEFVIGLDDEIRSRYKYMDEHVNERGPYQEVGLFQAALKHGGSTYPIECPDGEHVIPPNNQPWRWNQATFLKGQAEGRIVFKRSDRTGLLNAETGLPAHWNVYTKVYLKEREEKGIHPKNYSDAYQNTVASLELKRLGIPFDFAKPVSLISFFAGLMNDPDSLILDFFSGSATTAHAVMQLNAEDGGNRKFIMVQLPEVCKETSESAKAGYHTICEIGEERIRRAGHKIAEEVAEHNRQLKLGEEPRQVPDVGFRVLRIDSSNMAENLVDPSSATQFTLGDMVSNVKPGRTSLDLLFQVLPKYQIPFSARIEEQEIEGHTVYSVDEGRLLACFDDDVPLPVIVAMAKQGPSEVVMGDASFINDAAVSNFEELFRTYSPGTQTHIL